MMYIMQVGGMIVTALGQSATPTLARHFAAGRTGRFSLLLAGLVAIGAAIGSVWFLGAVFFGREILRLVYTAEFAEYAGIFVIAAIVGGINFVSAFLAFGMNAVRAFKAQMALQLLALLAIAVGCVILVPRYGLAGAIIAVGVSSAVQAMGGLLTCLLAVFRSLPRARLAASQNDESGPCPPSDEDRSGADPSASLMSLGDAV
jgi:O-antigen/teichoic acid export membrane protein